MTRRYSLFVQRVCEELVQTAESYKILDKEDISCWTCKRILVDPVASECGHTRCLRCVKKKPMCVCGREHGNKFSIDVTAQNFIAQVKSEFMRDVQDMGMREQVADQEISGSLDMRLSEPLKFVPQRGIKLNSVLDPMVRYNHAMALTKVGRLMDAASHFARVAVQSSSLFNLAWGRLMRTVHLLSTSNRRFYLAMVLGQMVRNQATESWVRREDLQCSVCLEYFKRPVTVGCGHTFCRKCVNQLISYEYPCALCRFPIESTEAMVTNESYLVTSVMETLDAVPEIIPLQENEYFVVSGVEEVLPKVRSILRLTDPNHIRMVKLTIAVDKPYLAIVNDEETPYNIYDGHTYGTIVIICDRTIKQDGSHELVVLGIYRFVVAHRSSIQGCDMVLAVDVTDDRCRWRQTQATIQFSRITYDLATNWYKTVNLKARRSIENIHGRMPVYGVDILASGADWTWWLLMVLPLSNTIKVQLLASNNLYKRLEIIKRTIDLMTGVPSSDIQLPMHLQKVMNANPNYIDIEYDSDSSNTSGESDTEDSEEEDIECDENMDYDEELEDIEELDEDEERAEEEERAEVEERAEEEERGYELF